MPRNSSRTFDQAEGDTSGPRLGNGYPLLKLDHVYAFGTDATLTGDVTPMQSEFGDGFYFGVTVDGKKYDLRVKEASPNFDRIKRIAPKTRDLRGKRIIIGIKEHMGRDYLCILDQKGKPSTKATKARKNLGRTKGY